MNLSDLFEKRKRHESPGEQEAASAASGRQSGGAGSGVGGALADGRAGSEKATEFRPERPASDGEAGSRAPVKIFEDRPAAMYKLAGELGIEIPPGKDAVLTASAGALEKIFAEITAGKPDKHFLWVMAKSIASDICGIIEADDGMITRLQQPRNGLERLVWHCLYTAVLAMELAEDLKMEPCHIQEIGAAALMHDIGLLAIPQLINNIPNVKPEQYPEHVFKSVDLARKMGAPECVLKIIAHHHQRKDGQGFPPLAPGETFGVPSQIVAMANLFELALVAMNEGGAARIFGREFSGMDLFQFYGRAFDADLLKRMIRLIGIYPSGSMVELNNRSICQVVRQNEEFPLRPVVKVVIDGAGRHPERPRTIDLARTPMLAIVRAVARSSVAKENRA